MYHVIPGLAVLVLAATLAADDKPADKPKAVPDGTPLELRITGKKTTYTLDTGGLTPAEYKTSVETLVKGGKVPPTPALDLTVEIKNTSDKPLKVWDHGDPVVLELTLKGKGAVNAAPVVAFNLQLIFPGAVEIAPGKSHAIAVKSLTSGFRGRAKFAYWTTPGDYELVATLKTGVQPAPKGAEDFDGFGVVTLTSAPFKVTVEAKK